MDLYCEGDKCDLFMQTKGIKNINEYNSLEKNIQDELIEEFMRNGGYE